MLVSILAGVEEDRARPPRFEPVGVMSAQCPTSPSASARALSRSTASSTDPAVRGAAVGGSDGPTGPGRVGRSPRSSTRSLRSPAAGRPFSIVSSMRSPPPVSRTGCPRIRRSALRSPPSRGPALLASAADVGPGALARSGRQPRRLDAKGPERAGCRGCAQGAACRNDRGVYPPQRRDGRGGAGVEGMGLLRIHSS